MKGVLRVVFLLAATSILVGSSSPTRTLTFEDRVRAQEAIERVYYSHQIGATRPFEEAEPREVLEKKVSSYLKQTLALEETWNTPVSEAALHQELERIARNSRFPDRLLELYSALDNDSFLIHETLARQTFVDRLSQHFFENDERIHGAARSAATNLRNRLLKGDVGLSDRLPNRSVVQIVRSGAPSQQGREFMSDVHFAEGVTRSIDLNAEEYDRRRAQWPRAINEIGQVGDQPDSYSINVVMDEGQQRALLSTYEFPKQPWDSWWAWESQSLDELSVAPVMSTDVGLPIPSIVAALSPDRGKRASPCQPDDVWDNGLLDTGPDGRPYASVVWTGTEMIVWGGGVTFLSNTGDRYNPVTDTWLRTSTDAAPTGRLQHTAVWTGSEMVIWGGYIGGALTNTGSRYDPVRDTWKPTALLNAPDSRSEHTAVWVDNLMIIWGGESSAPGFDLLDTGARYDPSTDSWSPTSLQGAPSARYRHKAVAGGNSMIVMGGESFTYVDGGRYDPITDTWAPMSMTNAPVNPQGPAVWTGTEVIVWGGNYSIVPTASGGRYDPTLDTWTGISTVGAPSPRYGHSAVWTGTEMIVWGGGSSASTYDSGGRYDPGTDSWTSVSQLNRPAPRSSHVAVWTGSLMIVWGGDSGTSSGGRYNPGTDSWTPTAGSLTPTARYGNSVVWTGNQMIVWGGEGGRGTGGRYDPLLDSWTSTSLPPYFLWRSFHTAVWTGQEMILWGGDGGSVNTQFQNTGDRYDPVSDTWAKTSTSGAPAERRGNVAVWTGSQMIIWGGFYQDGPATPLLFNSGGLYDPATDSWSPISMVGAPSPRVGCSGVWTGDRMIIWGGSTSLDPSRHTNTGAQYDPIADGWTPTSTLNAPASRTGHTTVWTGSLMVIWGSFSPTLLPTGGRYNPTTDTWTPTSLVGAPQGRHSHSAVWTGQKMIIWGGDSTPSSTSWLDSGGRYDPVSDIWRPTSLSNAPEARAGHSAVWTGRQMIIWGGGHSTGGRYGIDISPDDDHDFFGICGGDCDDGQMTVFPGAPQICDGLDNDCTDPIWPTVPGNESDNDLDGYRVCNNDCDDADGAVHPSAHEQCNGVDDDCNGMADEDAVGVDTDVDMAHNLCDNCKSVYNPTQMDTDEDGVGDACDNCTSVYNPGQVNSDGDNEGGDACDISVTFPLDGDITCGHSAPTITWSREIYNQFKVAIGADPQFKVQITSGKKPIVDTKWTVPATKWASICSKARPSLYIRVRGRIAGTKIFEYSETDSIVAK